MSKGFVATLVVLGFGFAGALYMVVMGPSLGRQYGDEHFAQQPLAQPIEAPNASPPRPPGAPVSPAPVPLTTPPATSGPLQVTRAEYGDAWPFTVPAGTLSCVDGHLVIFQAANGTRYAVNGLARGSGNMKRFGLVDFHEIWRANSKPGYEGLKVDIGPMIDLGLARCAQ